MDLAAHLSMTVGELRRRMTIREFMRWKMKNAEEPIGVRRGDYWAAQICATLANINRDTKKQKEPIPIDTFLLFKRRDDVDAVDPDIVRPEGRTRPKVAPETRAWLLAMAANTAEKKLAELKAKPGGKNGA